MNSANSTALMPESMVTPTWLISTAASSDPATPPNWNDPNLNLPTQ